MLPTYYLRQQVYRVTDQADFFSSLLPEVKRIKAVLDNIKATFGVPADRVILETAETIRSYKFTVLTPGIQKYPIGWFWYIPADRQLDLYLADSPGHPYIQWKNKKPVYKSYPELLDRAGHDGIFGRIVNAT